MANLRTLKLLIGIAMLMLLALLGPLCGRAQSENATAILSQRLFEEDFFGHTRGVLGDESANLSRVIRQLGLEKQTSLVGFDHLKVLRGALNFFLPFPGGNGRSCATCHNPADGFSLSPQTVESRWQKLQRARRRNPNAEDPLFRSVDADDGQQDFTLLRTRALIKVRVPLPARVRLTDNPTATHVTLSRAVPALNMLKHTAPYQQDRTAKTLEEQALGAVNAHMEPTVQPTEDFLETVAEFQRFIFSSGKVQRLSDAIDAGGAIPDIDPPLTAFEQLGKQKFDNFCGKCHGGPAQVQNLENRIFPPHDGSTNPLSLNIVVSNPPPAGFPASPVQGPGFDLPTQRFTVDLPNGSSIVLTSSDPGTVLTDVKALETVGGNQGVQPLRHPTTQGHQQDGTVLPRPSGQNARGCGQALPVVLLFHQRSSWVAFAADSR